MADDVRMKITDEVVPDPTFDTNEPLCELQVVSTKIEGTSKPTILHVPGAELDVTRPLAVWYFVFRSRTALAMAGITNLDTVDPRHMSWLNFTKQLLPQDHPAMTVLPVLSARGVFESKERSQKAWKVFAQMVHKERERRQDKARVTDP